MSDAKCGVCGRVGVPIKHTIKQVGPISIKVTGGRDGVEGGKDVCEDCAEKDPSDWEVMKEARKRTRSRRRNAMLNISKRLKIEDRVTFPNEGTCLLDGRVYYYAQKRKARVKGEKQYYELRGFEHFVEVFG